MLTEKHNVAGVKELIADMVNSTTEDKFRIAAERFMRAFAKHVGAEYNSNNAFLDGFDETHFTNLAEEYNILDNSLAQKLNYEFGLANTIDSLNAYLGWGGDGIEDFNGFDNTTKTLQGGDGADFLFTANREAKRLRKIYVNMIDGLISDIKNSSEFSGYEEDLKGITRILFSRKKEILEANFNNEVALERQKRRKRNQLYGTGARTKRGWKYDENGKKQPVPQSYRDITRRWFDPFSRNKGHTDVW